MYYEYFKDVPVTDFKILETLLYEYPEKDLIVIKQDWEKIVQKIKEGNSFNSYTQIFQIDSANDLTIIESGYNPHFGDKAELPNGTVYVRHSDDYQGEKWELAKSSGGGSGSDLPDYSEASDGDVLSIEDGEPAWKELSGGGGGVFIVTISVEYDEETGTMAFSADKTFAEIDAAHEAGKPIIATGAMGAQFMNRIEKADTSIVYEIEKFGERLIGTKHYLNITKIDIGEDDTVVLADAGQYVLSTN